MASPAIDLLIGKIVSFLESEVSLLEGVHDELHEVKLELLTMKAFLEDAERKGALSEVEKTWVANVRDVSIDVEEIIDEFTYDTNKRRSWGPFTRAFWKTLRLPQNIWERHRIATKLQKIIKTIKDIPERNWRYGSVRIEGSTSHHDVNRIKVYGESSLFLKDDDLVGITDARKKLVGWLLSSHSQRTVISVVGMGGLGKTTLVASTFNNQTVQKHFDCYTWITVSQSYTVEDLFRVMINELLAAAQMDVPQNLSNMSYRHLVEMLVHYLQPRRYMIVLDDVWDTNLWRSIDVALPNGTHGSRIMLTTRNKDIASLAFGVESHVHQVEPLNTNEAWDLFSRRAFAGGSDKSCPPELQIIARELVGKCEGLPLGLVALDSNIRELPVGIVKLQKLRHLFMYHFNYGAYKSFNSFQGTKAPAGICKLQSLQILDSIEAGSELIKQLQHRTQRTALGLANVKEADEIDLCKSIESMKLMECLTVKTSSEDEVLRMDALLSAPPLLKTLVLTGKLNKVPLWFASLESLTVLYLHWSRSTEDFLPHIHALPNLTTLWLCNAYVGNQLLFQTGFQKLSGLYITNFAQLNRITIERGVMPALKTLDISECMELKRLPRGIKLLTCLQKLHLHRVPNELVERMRRKRGVDHSEVKHISDIRLFH